MALRCKRQRWSQSRSDCLSLSSDSACWCYILAAASHPLSPSGEFNPVLPATLKSGPITGIKVATRAKVKRLLHGNAARLVLSLTFCQPAHSIVTNHSYNHAVFIFSFKHWQFFFRLKMAPFLYWLVKSLMCKCMCKSSSCVTTKYRLYWCKYNAW